MIFLPNKFERYTAALRSYIHISALKNGITDKTLNSLRKIHTAEALFDAEFTEPKNVGALTDSLLLSAFYILLSRGRNFRYRTDDMGSFLINEKLYTALLLTLCKNANKITVGLKKGIIIISANGFFTTDCKRFIKAMGGYFLNDKKSGNYYILIPAVKTDKKALPTLTEWEYISNPFSALYIYLV